MSNFSRIPEYMRSIEYKEKIFAHVMILYKKKLFESIMPGFFVLEDAPKGRSDRECAVSYRCHMKENTGSRSVVSYSILHALSGTFKCSTNRVCNT